MGAMPIVTTCRKLLNELLVMKNGLKSRTTLNGTKGVTVKNLIKRFLSTKRICVLIFY